jgi:hypothetical protein
MPRVCKLQNSRSYIQVGALPQSARCLRRLRMHSLESKVRIDETLFWWLFSRRNLWTYYRCFWMNPPQHWRYTAGQNYLQMIWENVEVTEFVELICTTVPVETYPLSEEHLTGMLDNLWSWYALLLPTLSLRSTLLACWTILREC